MSQSDLVVSIRVNADAFREAMAGASSALIAFDSAARLATGRPPRHYNPPPRFALTPAVKKELA